MIDLPFLAPGSAPSTSPLADAEGIRDLSALGKLEVRGADVDALDVAGSEVVRISPRRALVLCDPGRRREVARELPGVVFDLTAAWAGFEVDGEVLMRRLTDLDLDALPAVGKVATVQAVVSRNGDRFRLLVPRELAGSVAAIVAEEQESLA